jgi:hypothetical protein
MKDFLRLHSQLTSGRKHELAKRIVAFAELGREMPVQGPLAATYNIEGKMTWMLVVTMKVRSRYEWYCCR